MTAVVALPALRLLLLRLRDALALGLGPHDGVLTAHTAVEGALELGAQGQLGQVGRLLLAEGDALLAQRLVLHALEPALDVSHLGGGAVGRLHGRGQGGRGDAVGAVADGGAGLCSRARTAVVSKCFGRAG